MAPSEATLAYAIALPAPPAAPAAPATPGAPAGPTGPCGPRLPCSASRVALLRSTSWIVPFRICLLVMTVAATALPALAITTAAIATIIDGDGRRRRSWLMVPSVIGGRAG